MEFYLFFIVLVLVPLFVWESRQNRMKRSVAHRKANQLGCPHCGHVGAITRDDRYGFLNAYIFTLKLVSFGLLAFVLPGWRYECCQCGYRKF